jgi:hypothetical protein
MKVMWTLDQRVELPAATNVLVTNRESLSCHTLQSGGCQLQTLQPLLNMLLLLLVSRLRLL